MLVSIGCAAKQDRLLEADTTLLLPKVRRITFRGNTHFSGRELRKVMATRQRPLWPPWKEGEPYNPPTLQADLRRLKKFYFDRGFLDATVRVASVWQEAGGSAVRLEIAIEEGPPTLVGAVYVAGTVPSELPPKAVLLADLPLRAGERLTKAAFDRSRDLLLGRLQEAGYARARVVPRTEVDAQAHTATVTYTLHPGARTAFGRITIKGARRVDEQAIRRKLTIHEGQIYSAKKLTESAEAIFGLGMFQAVTPRARNFEEAGAPLHLEIEVRERKPRTVQVSFGLSSVERFRLQVGWTHRNLFGGAQRLALSGKISSIVQGFEARLHFPFFLWRRMTFSQSFFVRNEQEINTDPLGLSDALFDIKDAQPAFDLLRVGGEVRLAYRFTRELKAVTGLELSLNDFRNVAAETLAATGSEVTEDNVLLVQFAEVRWNTSGNLLNPSRGMLLRWRVEHANASFLSDVSFAKVEMEARHYQRLWWQVILATRLRIGGIQPYGVSNDAPFNIRFFAGGPGSVRGFPLNRLGPLDANGEPIGGNSWLEGSVELRFPLVGDFGGVVFVDFGNVFRDAWAYRLADLRYAIGPGVRYQTPIGPLRLDVGFIMDRHPGEDFGRFEFSIGQAF
jgi:outer membrane protein insertion porin family/translocation and assembly module TamA